MMSELSEHLEGMADSLDEHVTHEDIHRLLIESLQLSWDRDKKISAVLELHAQTGLRWVGFPRADRQESYCVECNKSSPCPTLRSIGITE